MGRPETTDGKELSSIMEICAFLSRIACYNDLVLVISDTRRR